MNEQEIEFIKNDMGEKSLEWFEEFYRSEYDNFEYHPFYHTMRVGEKETIDAEISKSIHEMDGYGLIVIDGAFCYKTRKGHEFFGIKKIGLKEETMKDKPMINNYKFRGKAIPGGEWVYGSYVFARGHHYILQWYNDNGYDERWESHEWIEVDPKTVGQFTGRLTADDKEMYKGDIVRMHQFLFDGDEIGVEHSGVIGYNNDSAAFTLESIGGDSYEKYTCYQPFEGSENLCDFHGLHDESFEVIGNIDDNPGWRKEHD